MSIDSPIGPSRLRATAAVMITAATTSAATTDTVAVLGPLIASTSGDADRLDQHQRQERADREQEAAEQQRDREPGDRDPRRLQNGEQQHAD
jgi:hypothetical protein